jgi:hypothetical protein
MDLAHNILQIIKIRTNYNMDLAHNILQILHSKQRLLKVLFVTVRNQ